LHCSGDDDGCSGSDDGAGDASDLRLRTAFSHFLSEGRDGGVCLNGTYPEWPAVVVRHHPEGAVD